MDEVLAGEVSHSICNLAGELEQEGGEGAWLDWGGGGGGGGGNSTNWHVLQNCSSWCSTYSTVRR